MSNVIRSLVVKTGADVSGFEKSMKKLSKDLKKTGKDLSSAGDTLTKGLTMPILGAGAALTGLAINAGKQADELITLSNKTGIATQALQEMEYAARFIDVEVETMTGSMQKLTKNMDMARRGSAEQEEAFKTLKVEYKNVDGTLKNAKEVWADTIDALGNVSSEADRDALAMSLFGKSAAELNPLIKAGSDELNRLSLEAHEVGAVMNDESIGSLGKFDDSMQKIQAVLKSASGEIAVAFIPVLEEVTPLITEHVVPGIRSFAEWLSGLIEKYQSLSPEMKGFVNALGIVAIGIGPVLSTVGSLTTGVGGAVKIFGSISTAIAGAGGFTSVLGAIGTVATGPIGIAIAAITGIVTVGVLLYKNWDVIKEKAAELWSKIQEIFSKMRDFVTGVFGDMSNGPAWESGSGNYSTNFSRNISTTNKSEISLNSNLYLDSKVVGSQVSKTQYNSTGGRTRAMGVTP